MPSARKDSTRWRRFAPTARAMPISGFRSAASMMKMRKMRRMPAAIEKSPKMMKMDVKTLPTSRATSMASFFSGITSYGVPSMTSFSFASTTSERSRPSFTPPAFVTTTA